MNYYIVLFLYFSISITISFFIAKLFENEFLKVLIFSLFSSIFLVPWFSKPGFFDLSPVLIIFLMENFIEDNNGFVRLLRPYTFGFFIILFLGFFFKFLSKRKVFKT